MRPQAEMKDGNVAEPDEKLRISPRCIEIQPIDDPIGALAAARCEDRPHLGIAKCCIEIRQTLLVRAGEIVFDTKSVVAEIDRKSPALKRRGLPEDDIPVRRARGGNKPDLVAR